MTTRVSTFATPMSALSGDSIQSSNASKSIGTYISGLNELKTIIEENKGLVLISFRAKWCAPCKRASPVIDTFLLNTPVLNVPISVYIIDIDDCIQLYGELKRIRILSSIPSVICYEKGTLEFFPVDAVLTSNETEILAFFRRCNDRLLNLEHQLQQENVKYLDI